MHQSFPDKPDPAYLGNLSVRLKHYFLLSKNTSLIVSAFTNDQYIYTKFTETRIKS